jgi:hypothetical protein
MLSAFVSPEKAEELDVKLSAITHSLFNAAAVRLEVLYNEPSLTLEDGSVVAKKFIPLLERDLVQIIDAIESVFPPEDVEALPLLIQGMLFAEINTLLSGAIIDYGQQWQQELQFEQQFPGEGAAASNIIH